MILDAQLAPTRRVGVLRNWISVKRVGRSAQRSADELSICPPRFPAVQYWPNACGRETFRTGGDADASGSAMSLSCSFLHRRDADAPRSAMSLSYSFRTGGTPMLPVPEADAPRSERRLLVGDACCQNALAVTVRVVPRPRH